MGVKNLFVQTTDVHTSSSRARTGSWVLAASPSSVTGRRSSGATCTAVSSPNCTIQQSVAFCVRSSV